MAGLKKIKGYTESELLKLISSVAKRLAHKFVFGIHSYEDIKQEGIIIGILSLEKFKNQAPLEAYLYTVIRSKLATFKRDNSVRYSVSCSSCVEFTSSCDSCQKRKNTEQAKYNLLYPLDITKLNADREPNLQLPSTSEEVDEKELLKKIDAQLPSELREDYLKMRDSMSVSKKRRLEIEFKIFEILGDEYE